MAKLSAWIITIIGVLLLLDTLDAGVDLLTLSIGNWAAWLLTVLVLIWGISKLMRSYSSKRRR